MSQMFRQKLADDAGESGPPLVLMQGTLSILVFDE